MIFNIFGNTMKKILHLLAIPVIVLILFGGCTSQKELTYLNNLDTTSVQQFFPKERPNYKVQYQDILYVNFFTMNQEMNELKNPGSGTTRSSYMFRDESSQYIYGYTVSDS